VNKKFWEELIAYIPLIRHRPDRKEASNNASLSLPNRCLATIGGIHIQTQTDARGFMKYAAEMGSGAMICTPSFIRIGSGIQKLIGGIHRQTHAQQGDRISLF
jgi:hypothetical protein